MKLKLFILLLLAPSVSMATCEFTQVYLVAEKGGYHESERSILSRHEFTIPCEGPISLTINPSNPFPVLISNVRAGEPWQGTRIKLSRNDRDFDIELEHRTDLEFRSVGSDIEIVNIEEQDRFYLNSAVALDEHGEGSIESLDKPRIRVFMKTLEIYSDS